jgi:hypothetical protein
MTREQYDEAKAGCFQLDGPDSECHCHRYLHAALALIEEAIPMLREYQQILDEEAAREEDLLTDAEADEQLGKREVVALILAGWEEG